MFANHRISNDVQVLRLPLSHLNRKTPRIRSVKRIPSRCVLVLNSARCKSAVVGLVGDLPKIDNNPPPSKPRNEFIFVRTDISNLSIKLFIYHFTDISLYSQAGL